MNEETIIQNGSAESPQQAKSQDHSWKHVTLGGVSGILMGAGLLYARQVVAATKPGESVGSATNEAETTEQTTESSLPVAQMHNDLSFGEAFAAARAEVGPGGVFIWHGGIYNTYTAEEWNAMTSEQKADFAQQVNPEVRAHDVPTPTDNHPDVAVHTTQAEDVAVVDSDSQSAGQDDGDVHIVGYGKIDGHLAVGYDTTGDGQADVAIIDVDDSGDVSSPDIVVDTQGNMTTVGEIAGEEDLNQLASIDNPDVAPDMPDYMNDAMIDA